MSEVTSKPQIKHANSIIYISNNFLDSIHKFTMPERRVLWYFMRRYKLNDLSTVSVDASIKHGEYAKLFNMSVQQASREISRACKSFTSNVIYRPRPEWKENMQDCFDEKILTTEEIADLLPYETGNIIDTCRFGVRRNESEIIFTNSFLKLILPVSKDIFTQYRLLQAKGLTNALHVALYEEFRRWVTAGKYVVTPTRLINKLQLPSTYSAFTQMRRGFLEPAIKSINKKTDLDVTVEEIRSSEKSNGKVTNLIFTIKRKPEFCTSKL